jgi:hypothetical protein
MPTRTARNPGARSDLVGVHISGSDVSRSCGLLPDAPSTVPNRETGQPVWFLAVCKPQVQTRTLGNRGRHRITEEEFRVLEMIEAERQEQINKGDGGSGSPR